MKRVSHWAAYVSVASSFGVACVFAYWLLWPYEVLSGFVTGADIRIETAEVRQGDSLILIGVGCNRMNRSGTIDRAFVDGTIYAIPTQATPGLGCDGRPRRIPVKVPEHLPPGIYRVATVLRYQVNPIRVITYRHQTEPFVVRIRE